MSLEPSQSLSSELSPAIWPYQTAFLDFVERHPEALDQASFAAVARPSFSGLGPRLLGYHVPIQPWPIFVDSAKLAGFADVSVETLELVRSLPERLFGNDPKRLCAFYGLDPEVAPALDRILRLPWAKEGESMRGDFLLSGGTLKCIEVNAGANAGGICNIQAAEAHLRVEVIRRFLEQEGVTVRVRDPWRAKLQWVIERAVARDLHRHGTLNLGYAFPKPDEYASTLTYLEPPYQALLDVLAPGARGRIFFCNYDQLQRDGDVLRVGGEPIHILFQHYGDVLMSPLSVEVQAWIDGVIDLYSSPLAWISKDKRNLALLSENAESDAFSRREAAWIAEHIPWSRLVRRGKTTYRGERVDLEALLLAERERFVLKPAQSFGGFGMVVGRFTPEEAWRDLVRSVFEETDTYCVQEHVESDLMLHQWGTNGCEPCEINWGLFVFGRGFGGTYLRVCPPPSDGIVNIANSARTSCLMELLPAGEVCEEGLADRVVGFTA